MPVEDMGELGRPIRGGDDELVMSGPAAGDPEVRPSIWPAIHPVLLELIRRHRSTLIFVNSRRLAERLAARLNELAGEELVRAHHGSIAREQRLEIEDALKAGKLPALVATSCLELGIDMGAIDLVVQVEAPSSVASGLQRIGRAGHQVGEPSKGRIFPKFRGDLVVATVTSQRMQDGPDRGDPRPRNPLDVLAQQIVAMVAVEELHRRRGGRRRGRRLPLRRPEPRRPRGRARHAVGPVPERRVRRAAAAHRVGPRRRHAHGPPRRPHAGRHQRRHHPRSRPVRRVHARGHPRRRARRGDGVREPGGRDVPPGRHHLAHRGDHPRPRGRHPGARRARQDALLARRPGGPALRAGPGHRGVPRGRSTPRRTSRLAADAGLDDRGHRQPAS